MMVLCEWLDQTSSFFSLSYFLFVSFSVETLKGWFRCLRDTYTRLDKHKSGDGQPKPFTEREAWIKTQFSFMARQVRRKPKPAKSVSYLCTFSLFFFKFQSNSYCSTYYERTVATIILTDFQMGTLTLPDTWFRPFWDLHMFSSPNLPWCHLSPRYFLHFVFI